MKIEYRVRPVTRWIVTRYEESDDKRCGNTGSLHGEYQNAETAYEVGYALAKAEHDRLGWPPGDEHMIYPKPIDQGVAIGSGGIGLGHQSPNTGFATTKEAHEKRLAAESLR